MSITHKTESQHEKSSFSVNEFVKENQLGNVTIKKLLDKEIAEFLLKSKNVGRTRDQICQEVKAPRSSVYDSLKRMMFMDIIEQDFKSNKIKKGRPLTIFYLKYMKQGNKR